MTIHATDRMDGSYWKPRFLELALRAIIKTHQNYTTWNIGQPGFGLSTNYSNLNKGKGIEFADERVVCAAITHEILGSNILLGHYRSRKSHIYKIEREIAYLNKSLKEKDLYCDLTIKKKKGRGYFERVYIEAKRVTKIKAKFGEEYRAKLSKLFYDDLLKLHSEWIFRMGELSDSERNNYVINIQKEFRPCLLLWGVWTDNSKEYTHPEKIVEIIEEYPLLTERCYVQVRWCPINWEDKGTGNNPHATYWLWVCLVELVF